LIDNLCQGTLTQMLDRRSASRSPRRGSSVEHLHHACDCGITPKYLMLIMLLEIINPIMMLNCMSKVLHEDMDVMLCLSYVYSGPDRIFNQQARTTTVNTPYFSVASLFILVQRFCVNFPQIFNDCMHCGICKIESPLNRNGTLQKHHINQERMCQNHWDMYK
jgi:hypothetical protein